MNMIKNNYGAILVIILTGLIVLAKMKFDEERVIHITCTSPQGEVYTNNEAKDVGVIDLDLGVTGPGPEVKLISKEWACEWTTYRKKGEDLELVNKIVCDSECIKNLIRKSLVKPDIIVPAG